MYICSPSALGAGPSSLTPSPPEPSGEPQSQPPAAMAPGAGRAFPHTAGPPSRTRGASTRPGWRRRAKSGGQRARRAGRGRHRPRLRPAAGVGLSGGAEAGRRQRHAGLGGGAGLRPVLRPGAGLRGHRGGLRRLCQVRRGDQLLPHRGGRRRPSSSLPFGRPACGVSGWARLCPRALSAPRAGRCYGGLLCEVGFLECSSGSPEARSLLVFTWQSVAFLQ